MRVRRIIRCVPLLRRAAQRGAKPALSLEANIEAIIVLGAAQYDGRPSRILSARLEEAVDAHALYPQIPIVTVGGKLPGDRFTEAEVGQSYLSERVPDACVLAVPVGNDTVESLREVRQRYGYANAIVITDPLHRLRVWLIARDEGMSTQVRGASRYPTPTFAWAWWRYLAHEMGGLAVFAARKVFGEKVAEHLRSALHRVEAMMRPSRRARHEEIRRKSRP